MGAPEREASGGRRRPATRRAVVLAWAAAGFVVWNVVFDAAVSQSCHEYLTLQALHQQGRAAAVTIRGVMGPGVARAARTATLSGGAVATIGLLLAGLAPGRRPRSSAGRAQ